MATSKIKNTPLLQQKYEMISLDLIDAPVLDMRVSHDNAAIEDLAKSIKAVGLLQPITITPAEERFEIVFGHRRFKAVRIMGDVKINCIIVDWPHERIIAARAIENLDREDTTPFEEAKYVFEMLDSLGCSNKHLAKLLGKSDPWVSQRSAVFHYPEMLLSALQSGKITFSVARCFSQIDDMDSLAFYLTNAIENGITPKVAEQWLAAWRLQSSLHESDKGEPVIPVDLPEDLPAGQNCHFCVQRKEYKNLKSLWVCTLCVSDILSLMTAMADSKETEKETTGQS